MKLSTIIAIALFLSAIALTTQAISATTTTSKTKVYNAIEQYFVNASVTLPLHEKIIVLEKLEQTEHLPTLTEAT
jgi:hypothetical protein